MATPGMEAEILGGCLKYLLAIFAIAGALIWLGMQLG